MANLTNFNAAKLWMNGKLQNANNVESLSGPGSYIENTQETINLINYTIEKYNIKSILDLGCGDWNWFKYINIYDISYNGWDCDDIMIKSNKEKYGKNNINFEVRDIVLEEYMNVDLIICRDVLFHIDKSIAEKMLYKIKNKCKYFITTSYNDVTKNTNIKEYCNIKNWGFYNINLNLMPFNMHKYMIQSINETNNTDKANGYKRYINLYKFN